MEFTEQTFTITNYDSETRGTVTQEVRGYIAEGTGLGYYRKEEDDDVFAIYVVTHLASGYDVGFHPYTEEDVRACIEAIVPLFDWNMPASEFYKLSKEDRAKIKPVVDAITTNYGTPRSYMSKRQAKELYQAGKTFAEAQS